MDSQVHARFWRASEPASGVDDLTDILLEVAKEPKAGNREHEIGDGVTVRLERCAVDGGYLEGELCRVQKVNFPPKASPDGLLPIDLGKDNGIGHVAAFRYHPKTRVLLLQRNIQSVSPSRLSLYLAATKPGRFFTFAPVMAGDAFERFKRKSPRSFSVTFAGPNHLESFDDEALPAARGARLIAEAYDGVRVTIEVSVGKSRKLHLDKEEILDSVMRLAGLGGVKKLRVKAEDNGEEDMINFLKEQMHVEESLKLAEADHGKNYETRKLFLKSIFSANLKLLQEQFK